MKKRNDVCGLPSFIAMLDLAAQRARGTDDLVEDAVAGYFDEILQKRETLSGRYDGLKSGRVKPIDGGEAFLRLKAKIE
jgi:hypothetical protein